MFSYYCIVQNVKLNSKLALEGRWVQGSRDLSPMSLCLHSKEYFCLHCSKTILFTVTVKASPFPVSLKRRDMGISCHIYAWVMPSVLSCDVNPSASQDKQLAHILMTEVNDTNMLYSNNLSRVYVSVTIWDIHNRHIYTCTYMYLRPSTMYYVQNLYIHFNRKYSVF